MEPPDVVALINRLDRINERGPLLSVLEEYKKALDKADEWQSEQLFRSLLFQSNLSKLLTNAEVNKYMTEVLKLLSAISRILVLHAAFNDGHNEVRNYLLYAVDKDNLRECIKSSVISQLDEQRIVELANCLAYLPDKMANLLDELKSPEKDSLRIFFKNYPTTLFTSVCSAIQFAYERIKSGQDVNLKVVSLVLLKARKIFVQQEYKENGFEGKSSMKRLFTDETHGAREAETMMAEVIHSTGTAEELLRCFGYGIKTSEAIRSTVRRLLLQRICPYHVPNVLAHYIAEAGGAEIYTEIFKNIVTVWSDSSFVKFNPPEKQKYLTVCLLEFLKKITDFDSKFIFSQVNTVIMHGVHERLGNSDTSIRQSGLYIGETFSRSSGEQEPLKFDYEEDDWLSEMKRIASNESKPKESQQLSVDEPLYCLNDVSKLSPQVQKEVDSDDEFEFEFESECIPERERLPNQLKKGEEPVKQHPPPNYITDAMEWLTETERYEKFEASLLHLESLVRRKAIGLNDIAPKLIMRLTHLEDKFCTKNFESIRKACIVACLVTHPELAPALGDLLFSRNCTFYTRYLILECFLQAAKELSEPIKQDVQPISETKSKNTYADDWRNVVDARIRAKTRLIGEKKSFSTCHTNRFAPVATMFFYPLLPSRTGEHLELRGKDAPFLAKILVAAAEILQCGAVSVNVLKMASTLDVYVWPLRYHDDSSLRIAVIFSYIAIVSSLPVQILCDEFSAHIKSWLEWLSSVADSTDVGEQERLLAKHTVSVLVKKLEETRS